jgi:hypothetical protein
VSYVNPEYTHDTENERVAFWVSYVDREYTHDTENEEVSCASEGDDGAFEARAELVHELVQRTRP